MNMKSKRNSRYFVGAVVVALCAVFPGMLSGQPTTLPTNEVRQSVCLNGTWNFTPDGGSATTIQVPATWRRNTGHINNIYYKFSYPTSWTGGTYSRSLTVPGTMSTTNNVIKLAFNSVRYSSQVSVNGTQVGTNTDGFMPFEFKVNSRLAGSNTVTVHVDANSVAPLGLSGGYAETRGIWQDVYLKSYPLVYVDNTFFIKTSCNRNANPADDQITTDVPVRNESSQSQTFTIKNFVTDATGAIVLQFDSGEKTLAAGESQTYSFSSPWANPHYWIPEDPYRHTIHTVIYGSDKTTVIDWKKTRFGFKELYLTGTQLYLNGNKCFLRGDSHHYHGEYQQTRGYYEALFSAMKSWGCNYYRPHTLVADPVMYDVSDSMGMMINGESAIYGSDGDIDCNAHYFSHLKRFIERDRNRPSVAIWSVSNEVHWKGFDPAQRVDSAFAWDPTRVPYAEENGLAGRFMAGKHYFDFEHCGPYATVPTIPPTGVTKPTVMGEYSNYLLACFGRTGVGACGYEVTSQDYGTGYWTHGETAQGQTRGLQQQRLFAAYCSWSIYWFACRQQPFFNNAATHNLTWSDLQAPGAKPQIIKSCEHSINWVDTTLPVYVPLPWFHQYVPYYQAIRCTDLMPHSTVKNCNFYAGSTITRSFDLWYESFQPSNHMKAEIVRKSDGVVLSSTDNTAAPWNNIQSGTTCTGRTVNWTAPAVTEQTPVLINRTFYMGTAKQSTCSFEGNIFPKFNAGNVPGLSGKKVGLYDPAGTTKTIFDNIGLTYTSVASLASVTSALYDVLVIGANNTTTGLPADFVINGGRVLCLSQTTKPALPINLPALVVGTNKDVQFLLNSAKHKIFEGIDQNGLTYWAGDVNTAQNVYARPTAVENIRVLCASNNDGDNAPILEVPAGKGTYMLSQMEIVPQYANEPVAGKLLVNMLNYLGNYAATVKTKTGLIADAGVVKTYFDGLPLRYEALTASALPADLSVYKQIIIDGSSASIATSLSAAANVTKLNAYVAAGGKVMVNQISSSTLSSYNQIINQFTMSLSTPTEKTRSVKCAVSWLRKNSPREILRYAYLNIPNPFEMNHDPLLMGINNKDLDWTATQLNNGIKVTNKSYPAVNELIAPYRINWDSLKTTIGNGEMDSPNKRSKALVEWFQTRTPVLLRLNQGTGFWLVNEILLQNDAVKGKRLGNLLLTSLGASVGTTDVYYNGEDVVAVKNPEGMAISAQNHLSMNLTGASSVSGTKALRISYVMPANIREIDGVSFGVFSISGKLAAKRDVAAGFHPGTNEMQIAQKLSRGVYLVKMSVQSSSGRQQNFYRQVSVY
jgi:hypothetical protein